MIMKAHMKKVFEDPEDMKLMLESELKRNYK